MRVYVWVPVAVPFVAVTVNGLSVPVTLSTLVTNPVGGTGDPLSVSGVTCQDGGKAVPCIH